MTPKYVFDKDSASFKKVSHSVWNTVWSVVKWFVATVSLAAFSYILLSFVVSTDLERSISRENRMYEKMYGSMLEDQRLLEVETAALKHRDNEIYRQIFNTEAPDMDPVSKVDLSMVADTLQDADIVSYTAYKVDCLEGSSARVEDNFRRIFERLGDDGFVLPPMSCPVDNMTYAQTGASVGQKVSPFYKVLSQHNGLDIVAGQGENVYASGAGTVVSAVRSGKGLGNTVTIDHGNGFTTRYAHLSEISVTKGMKVDKGRKIGTVGMTGNTLVPHLHYEVLFGEEPQDPVYYMFGSLSAAEFASVAFMAAESGQSLD